LPLFSGLKNKPRKKPVEADDCMFLRNVKISPIFIVSNSEDYNIHSHCREDLKPNIDYPVSEKGNKGQFRLHEVIQTSLRACQE
jgi:hypothetical protein